MSVTNSIPRGYDLRDLIAAGHGSRTYLYEEINSGRLRAIKRGRRTIIMSNDLDAWLRNLPTLKPKEAT
jgi:hypothetical protein